MVQRRIQVHVLIRGDLAPTGFRSLLKRQAEKLDVRGWVRNVVPERAEEDEDEDDDGIAAEEEATIEAVLNGTESNVDAMVRWCQRNPLSARIRSVEATPQPREGFFGFDLR